MKVSDRLLLSVRAFVVRLNCQRVLARLRKAAGKRKFRVVFLVSELAKWKCQSVFDRMCASGEFEPVVAVYNLTRLAREPIEDQRREGVGKVEFFRRRGMQVVDIQKYGTRQTLGMGDLGADIVFYQQPWDLPRQLQPWVVCRQALTFYFPYYTPNSMDPSTEIGHKMLHLLFGQVVCNEETAELYRRLQRTVGGAYSTRYLPFGYPTLDEIEVAESVPPDGWVIYAPHFSITYGNCHPKLKFATFLWNGRAILEYAKAHREIKWAFKPHPSLKRALVESGAMSAAEAQGYFLEWEALGRSCEGAPSDYLLLFAESRAMITDCGSFLTEYGCTGKPIIRLISGDLNVRPHPAVEQLYRKYYEVRTLEELRTAFHEVLELGRDPLREERLAEIRAAGITGGDAAGQMVGYLKELLGGKNGQCDNLRNV